MIGSFAGSQAVSRCWKTDGLNALLQVGFGVIRRGALLGDLLQLWVQRLGHETACLVVTLVQIHRRHHRLECRGKDGIPLTASRAFLAFA